MVQRIYHDYNWMTLSRDPNDTDKDMLVAVYMGTSHMRTGIDGSEEEGQEEDSGTVQTDEAIYCRRIRQND